MSPNLKGTPYSIDTAAAHALDNAIRESEERVSLLRTQGKLSSATLKSYYGDRLFEQVAESNAIEGSTLDAGETKLAVLRGITTTGHDPAYVRDARTLHAALNQLTVLAREDRATDIAQIRELHTLILGDQPGAGSFRSQEVRIKGSPHTPPRTWRGVMDAMEQWEHWSTENVAESALVRAVVLHTWFVWVHPYVDGNGRTARAVANLELVRAGHPPIIIRRKDRDRYLDALMESDSGGDLRPMFDLVLERAGHALRDLERVATARQDYNPVAVRLRRAQESRAARWNAAINLLIVALRAEFDDRLAPSGVTASIHVYDFELSVEDFIELCEYRAIRGGWCFRIRVDAPGLGRVERLAFYGFRSDPMQSAIGSGEPPGPTLLWSVPNPGGYPPWQRSPNGGPAGAEITLTGDRWLVRRPPASFERFELSGLARKIADDLVALVTDGG